MAAAKKKSTKGTRKATLDKRRKAKKVEAKLGVFGKRAVWGGVFAFVALWGTAWFFLSDADTRTATWIDDQAMNITRSAGYEVKNIPVDGIHHTDADALLAVINIKSGDPIFRFKPKEAKEQIERIGWVRSAHVERRLPDTIYIKLDEREPIALWEDNGQVYVIDSEGVQLTQNNLNAFKDLVMVRGAGAEKAVPKLMEKLSAHQEIISKIDYAQRIDDRRWDIVMHGGMRLKLPESGVVAALENVVQSERETGLLSKDNIVEIDARYKERLIVKPKQGNVQDYKFDTVHVGRQL